MYKNVSHDSFYYEKQYLNYAESGGCFQIWCGRNHNYKLYEDYINIDKFIHKLCIQYCYE